MDFSSSSEIDAPPERIWPILVDVERWPSWSPTMTSVELLDEGPLRVGSRAKVTQPKFPTATYEVTELVANRSFTWVGVNLGVTGTALHELTPLPGGRTKLFLGVSFTGGLAGVIRLLSGKRTQEYIETEARELKRAAETARA